MGQQEGFNEVLIQPLQQFAKDSIHLVKKCTKPDRKEFVQIARATGVGFLIMGFIGECCWLFVRVFVMLTDGETNILCSAILRVLRQAHSHPHQQHSCGQLKWLQV